ncbi:nuclear transport factor 2 family protein [Nocardioides sp. YIM 152588]|uniref:nuclear transport factor 2 family protein n=1 Tax=Nocardioides sp. YIM 152588 TaxID=3158259 RepID=UPI0032E427C7
MPDPVIQPATADGIARSTALLERWLPAFLAGRRADDDVYADGVSTWHNAGEWEAEIRRTPSRTRSVQAGATLRVEDVRVRVSDDGWVVQSVTVGTSGSGDPVRIPSCLVVTVRDGRIARFEEYADSRAVEVLFGPRG